MIEDEKFSVIFLKAHKGKNYMLAGLCRQSGSASFC
jgi:hypothetical protein